jgi:hypothetical protein
MGTTPPMTISTHNALASSFRDPSGFVFRQDNVIYRQINHDYARQFDHLLNSGLYDRLVEAGLLIPHREVDLELAQTDAAYRVIRESVYNGTENRSKDVQKGKIRCIPSIMMNCWPGKRCF